MENGAPASGQRRSIRRRLLALTIVLLLGILSLPNLWLALPMGKRWLGTFIQRRTLLETRITSATISPWSGIQIHGIECLQPPPLRAAVHEPLIRIPCLRLAPVWKSWLRGKPELQSIEVDSPHANVSVELISHLIRLAHAETPHTPPAIAANTPPPAPPPQVPVAPVAPPTTAPTAPAAPAAKPNAPPQKIAVPSRPTAWVRIKNASINVVSAASGQSLAELSAFNADMPVSGDAAEAPLTLGSLHIHGQPILTDIKATLSWNAPVLTLKPVETETRGIKYIITAKLGITTNLPLQYEIQAPKQALAPIPFPGGHAQADAATAAMRFRGFLLAPSSWQGELIAEALATTIHVSERDVKFDRGFAVTMLRGGMLSCVDARLIGDDLSLLGNATLLADGRAAAVLRLVAPPDAVTAIVDHVFPHIAQPLHFTPLSTPQRTAFDLEAFGNIRQIFLRLGNDGPIMELKH